MSDQTPLLLTHVVISEVGLPMAGPLTAMTANVIEPVAGGSDSITTENVPIHRVYPAGTLVNAGLAERLQSFAIVMGLDDVVVELTQPVAPVALDGDEERARENDPGYDDDDTATFYAEHFATYTVEVYSWPTVEPHDDL